MEFWLVPFTHKKLPTKFDNIFKAEYNHSTYAGIVQLVERFLAKEEVYGFETRCPLFSIVERL